MNDSEKNYSHTPVMTAEILSLLNPLPGQTILDATTGLAGHATLLANAIGATGQLVCCDRDPEAIAQAQANLAQLPCAQHFINQPYEHMTQALQTLCIDRVDRILMDLGVSSLQLDKPERGFSFMRNGPLDMRMDQTQGVTAAHIVNAWPERQLKKLFQTLGEERFSGRIAKRIAETRRNRSIETTEELSALVEEAVPFRGKIHPATRIFQALRMEVNDELGTLSRGLAAAGKALAPGGRLAVLTFHSLEDRLVKKTFIRWKELGLATLLTPKAVAPGQEEMRTNRRARSAKLRAVEKK